MKRLLASGLFAALVLAPGAVAVADAPTPAPGSLSLAYQGVLLVKVLDMTVDQTLTGKDYTAQASLKSSGVLSLFKRINVSATARGEVEGGRLEPLSFEHVNRDGSANRKVEVRWNRSDVTTAALPAFNNLGDPPASRAQKLAAADPLTQMMRISASPVQGGPCRDGQHFFDGRQLYAVDFGQAQARALSPREAKLGLVQPMTCKLVFNEVAGFDGKSPEKKNQGLNRPMSAEFARLGANGPWIVSAVRGVTPLGEARIEVQSARTAG